MKNSRKCTSGGGGGRGRSTLAALEIGKLPLPQEALTVLNTPLATGRRERWRYFT